MIVMPSNNTSKWVRRLFDEYPGQVALLQNPHGIRPHRFQFPYAMDNAAFKKFDEKAYFRMIEMSLDYNPPIFLVCPDVVGCHDRTLALWHYYRPMLLKYGYPLAFVAQDGCTPETIPPEADWIFVGGNDPWKMNNVHNFIGLGKPVHVGRVNRIPRLDRCKELGVDSVDGTGWPRGGEKTYRPLIEWLSGEFKQLRIEGF